MSDERTICLICTRSAPSPHGTMTDGSPCPNASRPWPAPQAPQPPQGAEQEAVWPYVEDWRFTADRLQHALSECGHEVLVDHVERAVHHVFIKRPPRLRSSRAALAAPPQGASSLLPDELLRVADAIDPLKRTSLDNLTCSVAAQLLRQLAASPLAPQEPAAWWVPEFENPLVGRGPVRPRLYPEAKPLYAAPVPQEPALTVAGEAREDRPDYRWVGPPAFTERVRLAGGTKLYQVPPHAPIDSGAAEGGLAGKIRELLWGEHPECCGRPEVGAQYGGMQESVCCGCPEPALLSDAQIVTSLRAMLPEPVRATKPESPAP